MEEGDSSIKSTEITNCRMHMGDYKHSGGLLGICERQTYRERILEGGLDLFRSEEALNTLY